MKNQFKQGDAKIKINKTAKSIELYVHGQQILSTDNPKLYVDISLAISKFTKDLSEEGKKGQVWAPNSDITKA